MKKRIALIVLMTSVVIAGLSVSLHSYLTDTSNTIDRNILCLWIDGDASSHMLDAVADHELSCKQVLPAPDYYHRDTCTSKCDPLTIVDKVLKSAKQTAINIKDGVVSNLPGDPR